MASQRFPSPAALALAWLAACSSAPVVVQPGVAVIVLAPAAPPGGEPDEAPANRAPWKVGAFLSLTGGDDTFGADTRDGIELGFDEVNAGGGPKGRKVSVFYEDDRSTTEGAAARVGELVERQKVVAVIGEVMSERSRAGGAVATRLGVPLVATASTHSDVTRVGAFVFRVCFDDDAQARAAARFMVRDSGQKRIGVLRLADDASSSALARGFQAEVARLGGQIVADEAVHGGDTDLTAQLRELQRRKPDLIYAPVYWPIMVLVDQQGPALGLPADRFVGSDGWYGEELLRDGSASLEGARFTDHWAPDAPWPVTRAFVQRFQTRYRREASSLAALGYDAALMVASALSRARDGTPAAVRDALQETRDLAGATGTIHGMTAGREPEKEVVVVRITGRRLQYQTTVRSGP